jgi:hypothetical protein
VSANEASPLTSLEASGSEDSDRYSKSESSEPEASRLVSGLASFALTFVVDRVPSCWSLQCRDYQS